MTCTDEGFGTRYPGWAFLGLAVGALPMGLFHATGRRIGARD
jgi:hypothetical protein